MITWTIYAASVSNFCNARVKTHLSFLRTRTPFKYRLNVSMQRSNGSRWSISCCLTGDSENAVAKRYAMETPWFHNVADRRRRRGSQRSSLSSYAIRDSEIPYVVWCHPVQLSVGPLVCLFVCLSVCMPICVCVYVRMSVCLSVCLQMCLSVCLYVWLSASYHFICIFVCLNFNLCLFICFYGWLQFSCCVSFIVYFM